MILSDDTIRPQNNISTYFRPLRIIDVHVWGIVRLAGFESVHDVEAWFGGGMGAWVMFSPILEGLCWGLVVEREMAFPSFPLHFCGKGGIPGQYFGGGSRKGLCI